MCTALLAFVSALLVIASAQTGCDDVGLIDPLCDSAPEGDLCLTPAQAGTDAGLGNVCGCLQDADCFNNPAYPYCRKTTLAGEGARQNVCDGCDILVTSSPATNNADHRFCRNRFPSVYLLDPPSGFRDATEKVSTLGPFPSQTAFREMCNRNPGNSGSCEPCWQASRINTPQIASLYVTYTGYTSAQVRAGNGAIHCRHVYPGPTPEARPICSHYVAFNSLGWGELVSTVEVELDIARNEEGTNSETRVVAAWEGACVPCVLGGVARHGMCALANPNAPICSAAGCNACSSNEQCVSGDTEGCGPEATCSGGSNCMSNGSCRDCTTDSDCVTNDGGAVLRNPVCDVASGICVDPTPCADNDDCNDGENCMLSGACRACTNNNDCVTNDGGSSQNQPTCDAGVCRNCNANADCVGANGANCQANGRCANCGTSVAGTICTATADGGETPAQTVCNTNTQICETACTSNAFCTTKGGSDAFTRGQNCQKDGTCRTCVTDATCGTLDGGDVPNQPTCDSGVCINPFDCEVNSDCEDPGNVGGGANCQADNQCVNCNVGYTSSSCGTLDGGEERGQINCDQASRLCVDACESNGDCAGTQGANCMDNGLCLNCRNDADCAEGNAWGGDLGDQRVCADNLCINACTSNAGCPANTNCNRDGRCVACTTDAGCVANDGPAPAGSNTVCSNGVCIDPYTCVADAEDNEDCLAETGQANCQKDGSCNTCTGNEDCGALDGGLIPNQPRCDTETGICGACQVNDDCPASAANCGADGSCYDCRLTGESCGNPDGGEEANQPNCDTQTGICVDFCTSDDQCLDDCLPHCHLDRGCCVECVTDAHCPLVNWRNDEEDRTECSVDSVCVKADECRHDDDCADGACSLADRKCVDCVADVHCSGATPACATGPQECVECVFDSHCSAGESCGSDNECHDGDAAGVLSFIGASLFVVFATVLQF